MQLDNKVNKHTTRTFETRSIKTHTHTHTHTHTQRKTHTQNKL